MDTHGYWNGFSKIYFDGTQDIHKNLEKKISEFLGTEDTILYAACFDANGGVFEPLFTEQGCDYFGRIKSCFYYRRCQIM